MSELQNYLNQAWQRQRKEKIQTYQYLNTYVKKGQIVMAGSSLMEQFPINEMIQTLEHRPIIYNRGVSGDVTSQLLRDINPCILDLDPKRLFINIGSNDMNTPDYTEERMFANYREIIRIVQNKLPDCEINILSYYPVNESVESHLSKAEQAQMFSTRTNDLILQTNDHLKSLANELNVSYIDVTTCLQSSTGMLEATLTIEGIHLWPTAYVRVFEVLKPYLV